MSNLSISKEIFKYINRSYQISRLGNVKMLSKQDRIGRRINEKILGQFISNGYYFVWMKRTCGCGRQKAYVHRLLLKAFVPNPKNKPCCNHMDGNKLNNSLPNLEWCTYAENNQHAHDNKLIVLPKGKEHPRHKKLGQYDMDGNIIKIWYGLRACARTLGVKYQQIAAVIYGKRNHFHGFKWKYITDL